MIRARAITRSLPFIRGAGLLLALDLILFATLIARPPFVQSDTQSYLNADPTRGALFPLLLIVSRAVFGAASFKIVQALQIALGIATATLLANTLRRHLRMPALFHVAVWLLLVVPIIRLGNTILTEPLSYAIFLLLLHHLIGSFFVTTQRAVALVAIDATLLILTRTQFVFVMPMLAIYAVWFFITRRSVKQFMVVGAMLVGVFVACAAIQTLFNYAVHRQLIAVPAYTGSQLLTLAMYVSDPSDAKRVLDGEQADFLERGFAMAVQRKALLKFRDPYRGYFDHFSTTYNSLFFGLIEEWKHGSFQDMTTQDWVEYDHVARKAARTLLRLNYRKVLYFLVKEAQEQSGYLLVLMLVMVGYGSILWWRERLSAALIPFFVGGLGLCNYVLVAIVEPTASRYLIYTDNVQIPLFLAVVVSLSPWEDRPVQRVT